MAPLLAVALACLPRFNWTEPNEDAGVIAAWAMQAAGGQVPYRDFFVFTTPGSVVLYAGVFKLLGANLLITRGVTVVAVLVACWSTYEIGLRLLPWRWAAAATVLWGVWLPVFYQYGPHHFWGTALLLLACQAALGRRFVWAGIAAALAVLFIQTAVIAVPFLLLVAALVERNLGRSLLPMTMTGLAIALAFAAWVLLVAGMARFYTDAVTQTLVYYPRENRVDFPWLPTMLHDSFIFGSSGEAFWMIFLGWPLLVACPAAIAVYAAAGALRWRGLGTPPQVLLVALASTGLFATAIPVRLTAPLAWFAAPLTLLLLAAAVRKVGARRPAVLVAAAVVAIAGLAPVPFAVAISCDVNHRSGWTTIQVNGGRLCAERQYAPQLQAAYDFHARHPGDGVAYLPIASSMYLVAGEAPPVPNVWIIPPLTMPGQLDELDRAFTERRVEYVLYFEMPVGPLDLRDQSEFKAVLDRDYERSPADDLGGLPAYRLRATAREGASAGRRGEGAAAPASPSS